MVDRGAHYHNRRGTSRSRSPARHDHHHGHRTRSPHSYHHRHKRASRSPKQEAQKELPYGARQLTKRDYVAFKSMFALYLDIQKQKILENLDEVEAKGRWKSFIGKWNRGELAEGWYDPSTLQKAVASLDSNEQKVSRVSPPEKPGPRNTDGAGNRKPKEAEPESSDVSDDSVGPILPGKERSRGKRAGPSIPSMEDLELKREIDKEASQDALSDLRDARKVDRRTQKERLEELVPRAEAGTYERRLEKKADVNAKMKSFRERSPGAAVEVPEADLMGGGDGVAEFKAAKQEFERKKNEREVRKEELLRARQREREERLEEYRAKEEGTMAMLRALAKERFG